MKQLRRNAPLLVSLTALVLIVSGCTIPGTDIEIPFLPDIFGGGTIDYTNDIIIIKNLQVTPGTTVKAGQTMTLYADIQNVQDPEKVAGLKPKNVKVELYDHCTNLFTIKEESCDGSFEMAPQEIKTCHWELDSRDVNLITPCELKVKVTYEHTTETVTSITFIEDTELQSRIRRGEPWRVSGTTTRGYGPVKAFVEVETQQPVSNAEGSTASISVKIRNVGQGYVKDSCIPLEKFKILGIDGNELEGCKFEGKCKISETGGESREVVGIKLIRKESTPLFCKIKAPDYVEVEQTYNVRAAVGDTGTLDGNDPDKEKGYEGYEYEFRKSLHVQIEPR